MFKKFIVTAKIIQTETFIFLQFILSNHFWQFLHWVHEATIMTVFMISCLESNKKNYG